ncbi:MAG: helix-hairpin-helix domain-containing protein, partial [Bacilli bacterium]
MYQVELIAIGNGTASRETEEFIASSLKDTGRTLNYVITSEAGASVYSASELAKKEYPQLQVEERSAISIARRVLDPLAELIKIDPKSIGVGQYQHDVNQKQLNEALDFTISKVVNHVGVNLNTATVPLLSYVSGLTKKSAENIVDYRVANGLIQSRAELKKIKGIGPKSFEQAVGFLKILDSKNPLDKTFIHPDNYAQVKTFLASLGFGLQAVGSEALRDVLTTLNPSEVATQFGFGEYSVQDIFAELSRPLRDIRDEYPMPLLRSDLLHLEDLKPGMKLQGTVRSIVDFGVFVDIGLKNDGMIHKSKLATGRIDHPLDVVSIGQIVTVYVLEVSVERQRVSLSLIPLQ